LSRTGPLATKLLNRGNVVGPTPGLPARPAQPLGVDADPGDPGGAELLQPRRFMAENGRSALEHSRGKADAVAGRIACCRHKDFLGLVAGGS
jgi:hypothetical protein